MKMLYYILIYPFIFWADSIFSLINAWTGNLILAVLFIAFFYALLLSAVARKSILSDVKKISEWKYTQLIRYGLLIFLRICLFIALVFYFKEHYVLSNVKVSDITSCRALRDEIRLPIAILMVTAISYLIIFFKTTITVKSVKIVESFIKIIMIGALYYFANDWLTLFGLLYEFSNLIIYILQIAFSKHIPLKDNNCVNVKLIPDKEGGISYLLGVCFLAIVTGMVVPTSTVVASPLEFIEGAYVSPFKDIFQIFYVSLGMFVLWGIVFYMLTPEILKKMLNTSVWITALLMVYNYFFVKTEFGHISTSMLFDEEPIYSNTQKTTNTIVLIVIVVSGVLIIKKSKSIVLFVYTVLVISAFGIILPNMIGIQSEINSHSYIRENDVQYTGKDIKLSRNGHNVIVIMLDRAIGALYPYIMHELPELEEQFNGFTYYPNMLSFGVRTATGIVPIMGGV